jgi:serine/threonine protein kinase
MSSSAKVQAQAQYSAPELFGKRETAVDAATFKAANIYSLGLIINSALTRKEPWETNTS